MQNIKHLMVPNSIPTMVCAELTLPETQNANSSFYLCTFYKETQTLGIQGIYDVYKMILLPSIVPKDSYYNAA